MQRALREEDNGEYGDGVAELVGDGAEVISKGEGELDTTLCLGAGGPRSTALKYLILKLCVKHTLGEFATAIADVKRLRIFLKVESVGAGVEESRYNQRIFLPSQILANVGGGGVGLSLRARSALKPDDFFGDGEDRLPKPWILRRWLFSSISLSSALRLLLLFLLLSLLALAFQSLPVEQYLKDFLIWVKEDLGPWGPFALAVAYIPLTVLAVPASVLTLGGGYLFGLPVGFFADSIGATLGATAAFIIGRTIGRSYVKSKLKNHPKFQAVSIAIRRSGFKIVFLLRLVPLLPFNMLNYLLSVTPVNIGAYILATWLGMMPITFAFVYVGTTLKDLSDVTHGWNEVSTTRMIFVAFGLVVSAILVLLIMKVAKASLEKALSENGNVEDVLGTSEGLKLPVVTDPSNLHMPLVIKIDPSNDHHQS